MTADELIRAWAQVHPPSVRGELAGLRIPGLPSDSCLWAARDSLGRCHLLVEVPENSQVVPEYVTRGLEVSTDRLRVETAPPATYIDLICLDSTYEPTFACVASDVVAAVAAEGETPRKAVLRILDRWRSFWHVDPAGLSRDAALGLFGELWFLFRWMPPVSGAKIARWQGPTGARHDFQWDIASIEVKTAAAPATAGVIHGIADLDQLEDPDTGNLYLFSLHVVDDQLAVNSLPRVVGHITDSLSEDPDGSRLFNERVAQAGYSPAHADRYNRHLRIVKEELFKVEEGFPRLTRSTFARGLPTGVERVSYCLSVAACAPWRLATTPFAPGLDFLRI